MTLSDSYLKFIEINVCFYIFTEMFELKMKYDESDNPAIRVTRAVTDLIGRALGKECPYTETASHSVHRHCVSFYTPRLCLILYTETVSHSVH